MDIVGAQQDLYYCSVCLKGSSKNLKQRTVSRLAHAEINKSVRDHSEVINTFNYLIQKKHISHFNGPQSYEQMAINISTFWQLKAVHFSKLSKLATLLLLKQRVQLLRNGLQPQYEM